MYSRFVASTTQANKLPDYKLRPWIVNSDLEFEEERQLMRFERTIIGTSPLDKEQGQSCLDLQDLLGARSATPRIKMDPYSKTAAVRHKRFLEEMGRWQKKLDDSEANDIMMRTKMGLPLPSRYQPPGSPTDSTNQAEILQATLGEGPAMAAQPTVLMSIDQKKAAVKQILTGFNGGSEMTLEQRVLESGLASDEGAANLVSSLLVALDGVDIPTLTAEERLQIYNTVLVSIDPAEAAMIDDPIDVPETGSYYRRTDEGIPGNDEKFRLANSSSLKSSAGRRYTGTGKRRPGSAVFMPKYSKLPPRPGSSASSGGLRKSASSQRFRPTSSQGVPRPLSADPLSASLNLIKNSEPKPLVERPVQAPPTLNTIAEPPTTTSMKAKVLGQREDRVPEAPSPPRPFTPSERKVNVASLTAPKATLLATQKPESARGGPMLSPVSADLYPPVRKTGKQWSVKKRPHRSCTASLRRREGAVPLDPAWKPPLAVDPNILLLEAIKTTAEYKQVCLALCAHTFLLIFFNVSYLLMHEPFLQRNSKDSTWRLLQSAMPKSVAANIWKSNTRAE